MDRMSSIELAIQNESTEMHWYLEQAERSRNPLARAMFETLAADEREHMTRIGELHERLLAAGTWPEDVPLKVAETHIGQVLGGIVTDAGAAADHDDDDLAALRRSAEFEARGSDFYAALARECEDPREREFFSFLSRIEREHMMSVQDTIAYLDDPESYLTRAERGGLDGA